MSKSPKAFVPDLFGGCTTPCTKCPYRKDAPLALWSADEFKDLLRTEADALGATYGCHNNDGTVCRGWFIDQRRRGFPSIMLRVSLAIHRITFEQQEAIQAPKGVKLFRSVVAMARTNFPRLRWAKPVKAELIPSRADQSGSARTEPRAPGKQAL